MVMARIDRNKPKFPTKPLPCPAPSPGPQNPEKLPTGLLTPDQINKLNDSIEFAIKDKDHNGDLSVDEIKPDGFYGELVGKAKHDFADTNHDGKVDRDEYHALRDVERKSESKSDRGKSSMHLPVIGKDIFSKKAD
jgi:hypothetical protein